MKTICLILIFSGKMIGADAFPDVNACDQGGQYLVSGGSLKGYSCIPQFMVDGLPTYDCGEYRATSAAALPPQNKCRFEVLMPSGKIRKLRAECDADIPGAINIMPPTSPPPKKYQRPLE